MDKGNKGQKNKNSSFAGPYGKYLSLKGLQN